MHALQVAAGRAVQLQAWQALHALVGAAAAEPRCVLLSEEAAAQLLDHALDDLGAAHQSALPSMFGCLGWAPFPRSRAVPAMALTASGHAYSGQHVGGCGACTCPTCSGGVPNACHLHAREAARVRGTPHRLPSKRLVMHLALA